jgi:hypothetical protein
MDLTGPPRPGTAHSSVSEFSTYTTVPPRTFPEPIIMGMPDLVQRQYWTLERMSGTRPSRSRGLAAGAFVYSRSSAFNCRSTGTPRSRSRGQRGEEQAYEASAGGVYGPGTRYGSARKEMERALRFLSQGVKRDRGRVERRDDPSNVQ